MAETPSDGQNGKPEFAGKKTGSGLSTFNELPAVQDDGKSLDLMKKIMDKKREKRKIKEELPPLNINSMMDIFTNILVYLIMTYSATPVQITINSDLEVPISIAQLSLIEAVPVTVTKRGILVNNEPVAPFDEGFKLDSTYKQGAFLITPLQEALSQEADKQKRLAELNPARRFEGLIMLIADKNMPSQVLFEVMYSAGQAEFAQFKFAVVKT